ncbi:MAG: hypothetical protein JSW26_17735 [Desulfobacterales bacterium]|nr:MAG: hypothetical protein JSW26_17735 [Desulfobacterales bacterium]
MKKVAVVLLVALTWDLLLMSAHGDEFQIKPYVAVRGEYNDNIFFVSEDEVDDYILTIKPGIELIERTERLDAKLTGEVAPFFYADNSDLNDVDQDYRGRIGYQFSPRFNGRADAFFIVDNRPDRDLLATGLVQGIDQRNRYHFGAGTNYLLSERAAVDLSYNWNRDDWDKDVIDREDLTANTANLGFLYSLGGWLENSTGRMNFGYANYDYDTSKTKSFYGGIGLEHKFSEILALEVDVGARYFHSKFDVSKFVPVAPGLPIFESVVEKESNSGWGGIGQAILEYRGEKTRSNLLVSRDLAASSGRTGPTDLFRVVFSYYYRFLEEMRVGLTAGYYHNKAKQGDFSSQEIDQDTFRIRPSIRWEFYDNFTLEGAYTYTYIDDKEFDNDRAQNKIFLQVAYGLPLFEILDVFTPEGRQVVSGAIPLPEPR